MIYNGFILTLLCNNITQTKIKAPSFHLGEQKGYVIVGGSTKVIPPTTEHYNNLETVTYNFISITAPLTYLMIDRIKVWFYEQFHVPKFISFDCVDFKQFNHISKQVQENVRKFSGLMIITSRSINDVDTTQSIIDFSACIVI